MTINWNLVWQIVKWFYVFSAILYWVVDVHVMHTTISTVNSINQDENSCFKARVTLRQIFNSFLNGLCPVVNIMTAIIILHRMDYTIDNLVEQLMNQTEQLKKQEDEFLNKSNTINNFNNKNDTTPAPKTFRKYRKKPVVIEAIQYTGDNISDIMNFAGNRITIKHIDANTIVLCISTLEGTLEISRNDYLIKGIQGEFYPCAPDIFWQTYEEVVE